jgi:hypothetical protein
MIASAVGQSAAEFLVSYVFLVGAPSRVSGRGSRFGAADSAATPG